MVQLVSMLSSRKDSKYLARFLHRYHAYTDSAPLLLTYSAYDTWNDDLIAHFTNDAGGEFYAFQESLGLGRNGLHMYYENMLPTFSTLGGDWLIYFCEDHHIVAKGWDTRITSILANYDPDDVHVAVPQWDNIGAMNHVLSRGFIRAMGNRLAGHGNLDSYINHLSDGAGLKTIPLPTLFHDYTHDVPHMLDDSRTKVELSETGLSLPDYFADETQTRLELDIEVMRRYGRRA